MAQDPTRLIWVDMEMTGLSPETDRVIEVAMVITDNDLNAVVESPVLVLHQNEATLRGMDAWNQATHARTGLIDKVKASHLGEAEAELQMVAFLSEYVPKQVSPMCGNSICQDRRFLARWMPAFEAWFHYRNLDVSTLKELCRRWKPDVAKGMSKRGAHTALDDIRESIDEMKYYREHFLRL